jgi:hypothetical protein
MGGLAGEDLHRRRMNRVIGRSAVGYRLRNIPRSTRNIVVGYLKSIFSSGEGAEVVNVFIVEALGVGGVIFDGILAALQAIIRGRGGGEEGAHG